MPKKERYRNRIELLQGTLDLLILQTLQWGPQHGYGLSQAIRANSGEVLQVDTGSLYPALHRLERQRWIAAEWKVSENKQRTKVYRLTAAGKKQLTSERARLRRHQPQHHGLALWHETQRFEAACALRIVLHEISVRVNSIEQDLRDGLISALRDPHRFEIAAAQVHGDGHVAGTIRNRG